MEVKAGGAGGALWARFLQPPCGARLLWGSSLAPPPGCLGAPGWDQPCSGAASAPRGQTLSKRVITLTGTGGVLHSFSSLLEKGTAQKKIKCQILTFSKIQRWSTKITTSVAFFLPLSVTSWTRQLSQPHTSCWQMLSDLLSVTDDVTEGQRW